MHLTRIRCTSSRPCSSSSSHRFSPLVVRRDIPGPYSGGTCAVGRCRCLFEPERSFWWARMPTISGFCCRSRTEITEIHVALPLDRHGESGQFLYARACRRVEPQMIGSAPSHKSSTTRARSVRRTSCRTRAASNLRVRFCCVRMCRPAAQLATGRVYIFCFEYTRARRSRATGLTLILLLPTITKSRHRSSRPFPYTGFLRVPRIQRSGSCWARIPRPRPVPPNCAVTTVTYTLNTALSRLPHAYLERAHGTSDPVRLCPIPPCVRPEIPPRPLFCTSFLLPNLAGYQGTQCASIERPWKR
ncbi:hypothetical protein B0H14DRAFT_1577780 [Mycena olivaceomarginata]|nr:hypothetical protein B0H14DRAFT_1577780 [Mycena olivaceomarginata]